mgnify:CR=1 FL=1
MNQLNHVYGLTNEMSANSDAFTYRERMTMTNTNEMMRKEAKLKKKK